jgi:hypothetical protein
MKKISLVLLTVFVLLFTFFVVPVMAQDPGQVDTGSLLGAISPHVQAILETVMAALAAVIAYYLRMYAVQIVAKMRAELPQSQFWFVQHVVTNMVKAAEQMYGDGGGAEKKKYVLKRAADYLAQSGLVLDFVTLEALLEAAVFEQFKEPIWDDGPVVAQGKM